MLHFYKGDITPDENTVFVFGSNPGGAHGAGAALVAYKKFGAKLGRGEGLVGNSYAIPTKNLENSLRLGLYSSSDCSWNHMTTIVTDYYASHPYSDVENDNPYSRSILPCMIVKSIMKMFQVAEKHPDKIFKVAYRTKGDEFSLNGYCGGEMGAMFSLAGKIYGRIPENVWFSEEWRKENLVREFNGDIFEKS